MVKNICSVIICGLVWGTSVFAAELNETIRRAYLDCEHAKEVDKRISNYRNFLLRYADNELADDALLEILKLMLEKGDIRGARAIVAEIEEKYPAGILKRNLFMGDPDDTVVAEWRKFIQENPIRSADWAKLLLARGLYEKGEIPEAKTLALQLLDSTEKPYVPEEVSASAVITEEIRGSVLKLAAAVAESSGEMKLLRDVQEIAAREYGVSPDFLKSSVPLLEIQKIRPIQIKESEFPVAVYVLLLVGGAGIIIAVLVFRLKKRATSHSK